jgi:hypothetical protein
MEKRKEEGAILIVKKEQEDLGLWFLDLEDQRVQAM